MVHSAELDLNEYSQLRAPIDGRIGDRRVSVGNLVTGGIGSNTTLLATIVSVDPIRFEFTFDEASYLRYQRFAGAGQADGQAATAAFRSRSSSSTKQEFEHTGRMDFVDNVIDAPRARSAAARSSPTRTARFTPGMFGRIRVPGSPPHSALLVPDAAIGTEQSRKYVLVVDDGNVVRQKYVTLGQLDGGLRVIKDGLAAGDRVIVNGLMRARSGQKVTVQDEPAPPPPAARAPDRGEGSEPAAAPAAPNSRDRKPVHRCAFRISSSTGRSSPPWSRSSS